jgi:hypothetical protein
MDISNDLPVSAVMKSRPTSSQLEGGSHDNDNTTTTGSH